MTQDRQQEAIQQAMKALWTLIVSVNSASLDGKKITQKNQPKIHSGSLFAQKQCKDGEGLSNFAWRVYLSS